MFENLYMIACVDVNTGGIGYEGDLLYHIPEDLKFFKSMTDGATVICGRNTYNSLPNKPLPNRNTLVLTSREFEVPETVYLCDRQQIFGYIQALNIVGENCFIIGGENVYKEYMNLCSRIYITEVVNEDIVKCDAFFPKIDVFKGWEVKSISDYKQHTDKIKYRFVEYRRK